MPPFFLHPLASWNVKFFTILIKNAIPKTDLISSMEKIYRAFSGVFSVLTWIPWNKQKKCKENVLGLYSPWAIYCSGSHLEKMSKYSNTSQTRGSKLAKFSNSRFLSLFYTSKLAVPFITPKFAIPVIFWAPKIVSLEVLLYKVKGAKIKGFH